jgi:uncharacterized protein YlxP (DUF503 family)
MELHVPESRSLKTKRQVVRRILDRTRAKFHVSAAEVDHQETWQRTALGFAVVSADRRHADTMIRKIAGFVESMQLAPVISCETEIISFGDIMGDESGGWDHLVDDDDDDDANDDAYPDNHGDDHEPRPE